MASMKVDEGNEVVGTTGLAVLWGQHSDSGTIHYVLQAHIQVLIVDLKRACNHFSC